MICHTDALMALTIGDVDSCRTTGHAALYGDIVAVPVGAGTGIWLGVHWYGSVCGLHLGLKNVYCRAVLLTASRSGSLSTCSNVDHTNCCAELTLRMMCRPTRPTVCVVAGPLGGWTSARAIRYRLS